MRTLNLRLAGDNVGLGLDVNLNLGVGELQNLAVVAVHVDLIDGLERSELQALEGRLELGVRASLSRANNLHKKSISTVQLPQRETGQSEGAARQTKKMKGENIESCTTSHWQRNSEKT